jgi:hypothetical protein
MIVHEAHIILAKTDDADVDSPNGPRYHSVTATDASVENLDRACR